MPIDDLGGQVNTRAPAPLAPEPAKPRPAAPELPRPAETPGRVSTMRTFEADLGRALRGQTTLSIAAKESARRKERGTEPEPRALRGKLALGASVLLILSGLGILGFFILRDQETGSSVPVNQGPQSLIFADTTARINTAGFPEGELAKRLRRKLGETNRRLGTLENIIPHTVERFTDESGEPADTIRELTTREFMDQAAPGAPDGLLRSSGPLFMYGVYAGARNNGFLFFEITDHEKAYAELLGWEKKTLVRELAPILREDPTPQTLEGVPFSDALIRNIDTRILRDESGKVALLYAFLNPTRLVITGGEDAFIEILRRYTTPRPVVR